MALIDKKVGDEIILYDPYANGEKLLKVKVTSITSKRIHAGEWSIKFDGEARNTNYNYSVMAYSSEEEFEQRSPHSPKRNEAIKELKELVKSLTLSEIEDLIHIIDEGRERN